MKKHHVACDLDGTLAEYDYWRGIEHIGHPVREVLERVKALLAAGHEVSIFTSRVAADWPDHIKDLEQTRRYIDRWCHQHVGRVLPVTCIKHGWFTEFWDDKALGVGGLLRSETRTVGAVEIMSGAAAGAGKVATSRPAWAEFHPGDVDALLPF